MSTIQRSDLELVEFYSLRCLVRACRGTAGTAKPLLCFLHGYDEGPPMPIHDALTCHGPLSDTSPPHCIDQFVIVAPQLPTRGDLWWRYAADVRAIVLAEAARHDCDPARFYLSGFSFGGNGVFDLALAQPTLWSAVWAVDPTRVPPQAPEIPVWLSIGEVCRYSRRAFIGRLGLAEPGTHDRVWEDEGLDHVGTAKRAYSDIRVYEWLLSSRRAHFVPEK
jgi:hypothetical protein